MKHILCLLVAFLALSQADCTTNPQCSSGVCCNTDCTFVLKGVQCRPSASDCDKPEFCTGDSAECPENDELTGNFTQSELAWDWVGASGQLKIWMPVCSEVQEESSHWIKVKFAKLQEVDVNGNRNGNWPVVNNLASNKFETRQLSEGDEEWEAEMTGEFSYSVEPRDLAQISAKVRVGDETLDLTITVMYFNSDSVISWTDGSGTKHQTDVAADSLKFNIAIEGAWPWVADDNMLRLNLDIMYPTASLTVDTEKASVTVTNDAGDYLSTFELPTGDNSPLVVDDEFGSADVTAKISGSHAIVSLTFPHFNNSIVYDPSVSMTQTSGAVQFLSSIVLLCLLAAMYMF